MSAEDMLCQYPENLKNNYSLDQVEKINSYYETLDIRHKRIMSVVVNYMKKVFEIIENKDLKIRLSSQGEDMLKMFGMDYLKRIDKDDFLWGSGSNGYCETYYESGGDINMEFYPFGKDGSLDVSKVGKNQGMSLFVLTMLKHKTENVQSESYEPGFIKLMEREPCPSHN